jgi:Protein of unknown function (DUF3800)
VPASGPDATAKLGNKSRWREVYLSLFSVFVDDSGTAPDQQVAISTCLIIPAKRIVALESEWNTLKIKEGFDCFHTSEFSARNYKSEFAKWDDEKHKRVFTRVRSIVKKFGVKCLSFAVNKKDYDDVIPAEFKEHFKDHYSWAVYYVVRICARWRAESGVRNPYQWIFDYMKPSDLKRKEIEKIMEMAEDMASSNGRPGEYKNFTFGERCDYPGLQCVDVLAWSCYQIALHAFTKKGYHPNAEVAASDFDEHMGGGWMDCITIKREDLEHFITKELDRGTALERFEAWLDKKGVKRSGSLAILRSGV